MEKYRIINILVTIALILLLIAFIFPFIRHENSYVMFFWIWGVPFYLTLGHAIFFFPLLFSIGIIVEIVFILTSFFILRKDNTELDVVSREWVKRGIGIIVLEFLWILWLIILMVIINPYGKYYIEVPIFFPLISGIMLIAARILVCRLTFREPKNNYTDLQWLEIQHYELKKKFKTLPANRM